MKYAGILMPAYLLLTVITYAQGSTCSNAINIPLDGVVHSYATSSSTGAAVVCTYSGNAPVTWFSFTTNAAAECPLFKITAADGQPCEIALYTGCNGGNILQTVSSMCFDDGTGLWAPAETYTVAANTTYYLRVRTKAATTLSIAAQSYTPSNNLCSGALPVDGNGRTDNNSCNKPSSEVTPSQICAMTIENTAFYQYYVASDGVTVINISSISCDNGAGNNSSGFQIGFFTGNCGSLTNIYCYQGSGSSVEATTPSLPAGTKIYVAIDGIAGSNCVYSIAAFNAIGTLATNFQNFSAWQKEDKNMIEWTSLHDNSLFYDIERSSDGIHFEYLGRVMNKAPQSERQEFSFYDQFPYSSTYYRVKQMSNQGKLSQSETILVKRKNKLAVTPLGSFTSECRFKITLPKQTRLDYQIIDNSGRTYMINSDWMNEGTNLFTKNISQLPSGNYYMIFHINEETISKPFRKL